MDPAIIVRAANEQDAEAIAHVHVESWRTTYTGIVPEACLATLNEQERALSWREWLTPAFTADVDVFVAEEDGAVVGFACGGAIRDPLQHFDAELFAIYLLEPVQGRGLGTALLRKVADSLVKRGLRSMAVWVLAGNASARFYARSGADLVASKEVEIAGVMLPVLAYGWPSLEAIAMGG